MAIFTVGCKMCHFVFEYSYIKVIICFIVNGVEAVSEELKGKERKSIYIAPFYSV